MVEVGSKTRSVGQIMEKPCEHSRGQTFGPIYIKLAQNVQYLSQVRIWMMLGQKLG